jgi:hypothetical protein
MAEFPSPIVVHTYSDLITALRAVKTFLQISDAELEALAGLCRGHWTKIAGACPTKRAGPAVLDALFGALAIEVHIKPDLAAKERISHRWQKRIESQVRTTPARLGEALLSRAAAELGRRGALAAAKVRRQARRNGHNGHAAGR